MQIAKIQISYQDKIQKAKDEIEIMIQESLCNDEIYLKTGKWPKDFHC